MSVAGNPLATPADKAIYGALLVEPITIAHILSVTELDDKRAEILAEAKCIAEQGAKLDEDMAKAQQSIKAARAMEANISN